MKPQERTTKREAMIRKALPVSLVLSLGYKAVKTTGYAIGQLLTHSREKGEKRMNTKLIAAVYVGLLSFFVTTNVASAQVTSPGSPCILGIGDCGSTTTTTTTTSQPTFEYDGDENQQIRRHLTGEWAREILKAYNEHRAYLVYGQRKRDSAGNWYQKRRWVVHIDASTSAWASDPNPGVVVVLGPARWIPVVGNPTGQQVNDKVKAYELWKEGLIWYLKLQQTSGPNKALEAAIWVYKTNMERLQQEIAAGAP